MIRIVLFLIGMICFLLGSLWIAENQQWIDGFPSLTIEIILFVFIATVVNFKYLHKIESPDLFVRMYLFMMALKLLAFGAFVVVIILLDMPAAKGNIVFFIITYILFTALEVGFLYKRISTNNSPK